MTNTGLDMPPTLEQVAKLQESMVAALQGGASQLKTILPADVLVQILRATEAALRAEPSLLELSIGEPEAEVFVFGDTHGHFPDVAYMLDQLGYPSQKRIYVFNGDYVDRGSWGVELLALLCCLKLAAPKEVYLLRGNHESSTCTKYYGYSQEVRAKYEKQSKDVYAASKKLFSVLPLAALIHGNTLVMHGGLFRRPPEPKRGAKRRKPNAPTRAGAWSGSSLVPGSLDDLRRATKGGMDPDGCGASLLATDVLWSDPVAAPGFRENDARGVGLIFGPDITQAFLTANRLRLIIRSHEGPDARDKRSDLPQVLQGYSIDHDTPAGQLVTVFSAPDYPQFQALTEEENGGKRYENLAAVAVLSAPDYATPKMRTFEAVKPRPKADAYYDFAACCDSDTEAPAGSEGGSEGGSGAGGEADCEGDEAQGPPAPQSPTGGADTGMLVEGVEAAAPSEAAPRAAVEQVGVASPGLEPSPGPAGQEEDATGVSGGEGCNAGRAVAAVEAGFSVDVPMAVDEDPREDGQQGALDAVTSAQEGVVCGEAVVCAAPAQVPAPVVKGAVVAAQSLAAVAGEQTTDQSPVAMADEQAAGVAVAEVGSDQGPGNGEALTHARSMEVEPGGDGT